MTERKTAGELSHKALSDKTKYDAREVAHAVTDDISKHIYEAIENYHDKIEENEFCVVMLIATDPLIKNLKRRKFYCWPYLPSPRPNQAVFLYNKSLSRITKRLWVLPCAEVMAELATSNLIVHKQYQTMRDWSVAFFKGTFWEFIRYEHDIKILSQEEYFEKHKDKLMAEVTKETLAGKNPFSDMKSSGKLANSKIDLPTPSISDSFDFSKIICGNFGNPVETI